MQKIKTASDLKDTIQQLELRQATELALLKEQFHNTCESLKPVNILKNIIKEAYSKFDLKTTMVKAAMGFTTGFVTRKVFTGNTHNPLKKLLGFAMEALVANKVVQNADGIKSIGRFILNKVTGRNNNPEKE